MSQWVLPSKHPGAFLALLNCQSHDCLQHCQTRLGIDINEEGESDHPLARWLSSRGRGYQAALEAAYLAALQSTVGHGPQPDGHIESFGDQIDLFVAAVKSNGHIWITAGELPDGTFLWAVYQECGRGQLQGAGIYTDIRDGVFDNPSDYAEAAGRPHQSWRDYASRKKGD